MDWGSRASGRGFKVDLGRGLGLGLGSSVQGPEGFRYIGSTAVATTAQRPSTQKL